MEKQELFCHLNLNLLAIRRKSELKWSLRGADSGPKRICLTPIIYEVSLKTISKEEEISLIPEVTGTDEALALVSLVTGLSAGYLADVWTGPFLHYCQRYCDQPVIKHRKLNFR